MGPLGIGDIRPDNSFSTCWVNFRLLAPVKSLYCSHILRVLEYGFVLWDFYTMSLVKRRSGSTGNTTGWPATGSKFFVSA